MERNINMLIENEFTKYKNKIKTEIVELINQNKQYENIDNNVIEKINSKLMLLLQELYDYPILKLEHDVFQKRKRTKNFVELQHRCIAYRANGEQCTRKKKSQYFCGTHLKGTPHGYIKIDTNSLPQIDGNIKVQVWTQDIGGIHYYIDDNNNVYDSDAILFNEDCPSVIAKYTKSIDQETGEIVYHIPEFNL